MKIIKIILIIIANLILTIFLVGIVQFFMLIILGIDFNEPAKYFWLGFFYIMFLFINVEMLIEGHYKKMIKD